MIVDANFGSKIQIYLKITWNWILQFCIFDKFKVDLEFKEVLLIKNNQIR